MKTKQICQHFQSLGLSPKESNRFSNLIHKWVDANGFEWTTKRLKSLTEAFKKNLSDGGYHLPDGWATRKNRNGDTIVKDGIIHRLLSSKTQREIFISNSFFRVHTLFTLDKVSKAQKRKFDEAVLPGLNVPDEEAYQKEIESVSAVVDEVTRGFKPYNPVTVGLRYVPKGNKTSPIFDYTNVEDIKVTTAKRTDIQTKSLLPFLATPFGKEVVRLYKDEVADAILGPGSTFVPPAPKMVINDIPIGTIGYIQEQSCKLRSIASPALIWQALSEKLKLRLKKIIESLEVCDTKDHDEGRVKAQMWLYEGRNVYGFDASSFTDRLPLELQLKILLKLQDKGLITEFDYVVYEHVAKGVYVDNEFNRLVRWGTGQPQGHGPSFNLATLTHVCILQSCITSPEQQRLFSVIGDDVVIADDALAESYRDKMTALGVDINLSKSTQSELMAEYAGKLILADGIIPSAKVKLLKPVNHMTIRERNALPDILVSQLEFYGPRRWNTLPPDLRSFALKSILPEWVGGINFKHPDIHHSVNYDSLRITSIKRDIEEYLTTHKRDDVEAYLNWLSEFDSLLMSEVTLPSIISWNRYNPGAVKGISNISGLPIATSRTEQRRDVPRGQVQKVAKTTTGVLAGLLVHHMYQFTNPDRKKSVIIEDYGRTMRKLASELTPTQLDFVHLGLPHDVVKFFVTPEGYIRKEFIQKMEKFQYLKQLIPSDLIEKDLQGTSPKGQHNAKHIRKPRTSGPGGR